MLSARADGIVGVCVAVLFETVADLHQCCAAAGKERPVAPRRHGSGSITLLVSFVATSVSGRQSVARNNCEVEKFSRDGAVVTCDQGLKPGGAFSRAWSTFICIAGRP